MDLGFGSQLPALAKSLLEVSPTLQLYGIICHDAHDTSYPQHSQFYGMSQNIMKTTPVSGDWRPHRLYESLFSLAYSAHHGSL